MINELTMLDQALQYASKGIKVFPLKENSKSGQVLNSWKKEASTNIETIMNWWTQNPNYNIGLALDESLLVIDIDRKNEKDGLLEFQEWESVNGKLPATAIAKTPNNGFHIYFYVDRPYKNSVSTVAEGIDIKTNGGYVVAPPSIVDGKPYEWANNNDIGLANENVYGFLNRSKESTLEQLENSEALHLNQVISEGTRNEAMFRLASYLQTKGIDPENILKLVWAENNKKCNPPLSDSEIKTLVKSAMKYTNGDNSYVDSTVTNSNVSKINEVNMIQTGLITFGEIKEEEIDWLIPGWIARGQITNIGGDGGSGKTTCICNVVAAVSSGRMCFFEDESTYAPRPPGKVLFFSAEDDVSKTLARRLRKNGATMKNVLTMRMSDERREYLELGSPYMESLIAEHRPVLVVLDPLQSYVPAKIDMAKRNHMRKVLTPLFGWGEKYGTSFLIVMHTNKKQGVSGRGKLADSSDMWDIARGVIMVGSTKEEDIRYFSQEKNNYSKLKETVLVELVDEVPIKIATTHKKEIDFMNERYPQKQSNKIYPKDEAKSDLLEYLEKEGGQALVVDVDDYLKSLSYSASAIRKSKTELKQELLVEQYQEGSNENKKYYLRVTVESDVKYSSTNNKA